MEKRSIDEYVAISPSKKGVRFQYAMAATALAVSLGGAGLIHRLYYDAAEISNNQGFLKGAVYFAVAVGAFAVLSIAGGAYFDSRTTIIVDKKRGAMRERVRKASGEKIKSYHSIHDVKVEPNYLLRMLGLGRLKIRAKPSGKDKLEDVITTIQENPEKVRKSIVAD
jgi:hypothetical protein